MDCSNNKNSSNQSSAPPHVAMFPFMAQGHIIPFLSLAKLLVHRHRTLTVTFLNTPHTIEKLISSDSGACSGRLRFVALPFDAAAHGLPAGADNTDSLPHPLIPALMHASSALSPHFDALLPSLSPPCTAVIADVFLSWTVAVARRHRVPHAVFTTCGAYGTAAYFSLWLHLPHRSADGQGEFHVPGFPDTFRLKTDQLSFYMQKADGMDGWSTFLRPNILESMRSQSMICNTVAELEPAGLRILQEVTGMRVIRAVGPLLPLDAAASYGGRSGRAAGVGTEECAEWLRRHPPASVLYVSFGSQNAIAAPQMRALAAGIEAAGVPFVWVVRPPFGSADVNDEIREEWLPDGFAARMAENRRGLLVKQWAPQLEILSHTSTGAFLSHCGWNSTLESLSRGVPIIGWPLASEQFYNSKMLEEELGVCVELTRGVESAVESAEVERVIRAVIGGEKGKEMKRRAETCAEIIHAAMREGEEGGGDKRKGSSIRAIDEFIEEVVSKSQMQGNGECSEE